MGLNQGSFHEFATFVDPATVPGPDLVTIPGTDIGLKHDSGIGGAHDLPGGIHGSSESGTGQLRAEHAGAGLVLLHRTNKILHAIPFYHAAARAALLA